MTTFRSGLHRRGFLGSAIGGGLGLLNASRNGAAVQPPARARIAITLDLEMSRHYPTWDQTHWDYEKGNLDGPTKRYAVEAARRVKALGGRIHFFCVARVLEQENVEWLEELIENGHPVGNHTYDHVNILATKPEDVQFRFQRAPWLIAGKTAAEAIVQNVALGRRAMEQRLKHEPDGFRAPGGFHNGLNDRPDVQAMLIGQGYKWVSTLYPPHPNSPVGSPPDEDVLRGIVAAQARAQPFVYPSGLVEVPMGPISDVGAFRTAKWPLASFLEAVRRAVAWAIENHAVFDFLAHPSCLVVADPRFQTIELIARMVGEAGDRAELVGLDAIAGLVAPATRAPNGPAR